MPKTTQDHAESPALFIRVKPRVSAIVPIVIDGRPFEARAGDTVLTAVLLAGAKLRTFEFGGEPRAGFCLMGACQDCWVATIDRQRLRACTTVVTAGLSITTTVLNAEGTAHAL
jgi:D-hydroxyproline dehydrogenase subunit gamma